MDVIALVTQKGGSGKSTLAFSLAVAAQQQGRRVFGLDIDPQRTFRSWFERREADDPPVDVCPANEIETALDRISQAGYGLTIIDTPGRDDYGSSAAIRAASMALIPCRPTPADLQAIKPTIDAVNRVGRPAAFVLSQTPPRSYRIKEARQALEVWGLVAPPVITARNDHQDAQGLGLGVTEYAGDGKAAAEMAALWRWLENKLKKVQANAA